MTIKKTIQFLIIALLFYSSSACKNSNIPSQTDIESIDPVLWEKIEKLERYSPLGSNIFIVGFKEDMNKKLITISNLNCLTREEHYSGYFLFENKRIIIQDHSNFGSIYYDNSKIQKRIPDNFLCSKYDADSTYTLIYIKIDSLLYRYGASANFLKLKIQINDSTENPNFLF